MPFPTNLPKALLLYCPILLTNNLNGKAPFPVFNSTGKAVSGSLVHKQLLYPVPLHGSPSVTVPYWW